MGVGFKHLGIRWLRRWLPVPDGCLFLVDVLFAMPAFRYINAFCDGKSRILGYLYVIGG